MAEIEVLLPKMGESVAEATITTWLKSVGDTIEEDEPIVEIATDKVDSEVPSPASGILKKILFKEGDVVQVGTAFAIIGGEGSGGIIFPQSHYGRDALVGISLLLSYLSSENPKDETQRLL